MAEDVLDPSALSKGQFLQLIDDLQKPPTPPSRPSSLTLDPATQAAVDRASAQLPKLDTRNYVSPEGQRMGVRPGAFLDVNKGAPAGVRFKLGLDPNQLNQFKLLNHIYGPGNVDLSDEGRFIVRNQGENGKNDFMVDPIGVDAGDAAEMGSQIGPMIAGALAARYGGAFGKTALGKIASATTAMALGTELTGAAQDSFIRWLRDNQQDFSEIAKRRAAAAVADEVFGFAAAGAAKTLSTGLEGLAGLGQIRVGQTGTEKAAATLANKTDVQYPLTPGEATGNKLLLRLESMARGRPGSASAMDRFREAQQSVEDELRRVFLGLPRTMSNEDLANALPKAEVTGAGALRRVGMEADRLESNVESAKDVLRRTGSTEAQKIAAVDLSNPLNVTDIGEQMRNRVVTEFSQGHANFGNRYEAFLSQPEIQSRTVAGKEIALAAKDIEKEFVPAAEKTVKEPSYDAYGGPTEVDVKRTEQLNKFVDTKFRGFVDELKGLQNAKVSVNDLKRIRTSIDNSIKEGIAIPGVDTAQLQSLREAVDNNITSALNGMPNQDLLKEWNGLRNDYSEFQKRFDKVGIREMLIRPGEKGSIGSARLAESVTGNSPEALDRYNAFKEFFGENSPEFKNLKTVAKQDALFGSLTDEGGYIEGTALRARLKNIRPEIAQDLLGIDKQQLVRIGKALEAAQGRIDVTELANRVNDGTFTARTIPDLLKAENARAEAFNNKLISAASKGTLNAENIKASDFVRYAANMNEPEAARVMGILADRPDLIQEIRQLGVEDIWQRVQAGAIGHEQVSSKLVDDALGPPDKQRTWRAILGNDTVDSLKALADTVRSREFGTQSFKSGSQLAGATDLQRIFMHGEIGAVPEIASRMLIGFLYSAPLRKMITNLATGSDRSRLLNGVVASAPFMEHVLARYGSDGAMPIFSALRNMVEPLQRKDMFVKGEIKDFDPSKLNRDEFLQWMQNTGGNILPTKTK